MRQESGAEQQVFQRAEKLAVEMGNIVHKMCYQVPETLFGLDILLTAYMTIPSLNHGPAVKTVFLLSFS